MIGRLLCRIGWHDWVWIEVLIGPPGTLCPRCGKRDWPE